MTDKPKSEPGASSQEGSGRPTRGENRGGGRRARKDHNLSLAEEIAQDLQKARRDGKPLATEPDFSEFEGSGVDISALQQMSPDLRSGAG